MSRQNDEARTRISSKKSSDKATVDFWSFHPTESDKKAMAAFESELGDPYDALQVHVDRGVAFTLKRAATNDSVCLIARDGAASYGEGQALSVFHAETRRAIVGMLYVLDVLFPTWPHEQVRTGQRQIDW